MKRAIAIILILITMIIVAILCSGCSSPPPKTKAARYSDPGPFVAARICAKQGLPPGVDSYRRQGQELIFTCRTQKFETRYCCILDAK